MMGTSHEAPMMRGIEEWNRHAVPAVRDAAGNIVTPGHDPYGGTGEWSFRRNGDAIKAYWTDGIRRMAREDFEGVVTLGMRGNGDVEPPRRRRHRADVGDHRRRAGHPRPRAEHRRPTGLDAVQGGPAVLGAGPAPARRRHRGLHRRQLGQHPQAPGPLAAAAPRRVRAVLPLRLRRGRPQLQVGRHRPAREHVGAAAPGRGVRQRPTVGRERRRREGQRTAAAVLPRLRVGPVGVAGVAPVHRGACVRRGELRVRAGFRHRVGLARLRAAPVPPEAGAAEPPDHDRRRRGDHLRRPGDAVQPGRLPRAGPGHRRMAGSRGAGGSHRGPAARGLPGRLLRTGFVRGHGVGEPLRVAPRRVHEPALRGPGKGFG